MRTVKSKNWPPTTFNNIRRRNPSSRPARS